MHPASIGPFQILRELGRGGMGEVYLARDTRLDRQVAIKSLPAHLATDPDRLARFQREAKVLASLNHPGISAIHGLEEVGGQQFLILEFVEGETLADRLTRGAIPVDEALTCARQIAEALEVAHEKGIVHRDLKPGNVMITPDGVIKVLDFGLARTEEGSPSASGPALADSPTITSPARLHSPTIPGVIMGTAGYMSPEQARGRPVDKRSDIFSFGCVLYEMLSNSQPFRGETVADAIGATLHKELDFALLPPITPSRVRELLTNCLAKDRKQRLHDIGDARLELERAIAGHDRQSAAPQPRPRQTLQFAAIVLLVAATSLATGWFLANKPAASAPAQTLHVSTSVPDKPPFDGLVGISPDSKFLVYTALPEQLPDSVKPDGLLVVRRLDRDETVVIEGTEGAQRAALSPDGRWIAYSCAKDRARSKWSLKKVALENGRPSGKPETVCEFSQGAYPTLCWASDREIVYSMSWEPTIYAVSASGGEPRVVLKEELPKGIENWGDFRPLVLGKSVLATRFSFVGQKAKVNCEVIELATGKRTLVLSDAGSPQYVPDGGTNGGRAGGGGSLLAMRSSQTSLVAVRFDPATLHTSGEPITVWSGNQINAFQLSGNGTLALTTRSLDVSDRRLAWIDEKGQPTPIPGMTRAFGEIRVSTDCGRVLAQLENSNPGDMVSELSVIDLSRRTSTRIPVQGALIGLAWSTNGQRIAYGLVSDGAFSICERRSDGSGDELKLYSGPDSRTLLFPSSYTPDDKVLSFGQVNMSTDDLDAYLLEQEAGSKKWVTKPYMKSSTSEVLAGFSHDGKWALIGSNQSGRSEWYVQPFTGDGDADTRAGRVPISTSGGDSAWWSPDGKEIRYLDLDKQVMTVQVKTDPTFAASEPKFLYSIKDLKTRSVVFAPDGRLMVVLQGDSEKTTKKVDLVVNFLEEFRSKMPIVP